MDSCCSKFCWNKRTDLKRTAPPTNWELESIRVKHIKVAKEEKRELKRQQKEARNKKRRAVYLSASFYKSQSWREVRYDVLAKYGRGCMLCGVKRGAMHVDHIIPRSTRPDLALDKSNLQVLCEQCNLGKSNRDSKDFRPEELK